MKRPEEHPAPTFTLSGEEFLRRFLVHVPAKGQRVVRHFGIFHHRLRDRLGQARRQLAAAPAAAAGSASVARTAPVERSPPALRCPHCGRPLAVVLVVHASRGPPERQVA